MAAPIERRCVSRFDDRKGQNNSIFGFQNNSNIQAVSWVKFSECTKRWSVLTGSECDIAAENAAVILNDPTDEFGYHRNCYKR